MEMTFRRKYSRVPLSPMVGSVLVTCLVSHNCLLKIIIVPWMKKETRGPSLPLLLPLFFLSYQWETRPAWWRSWQTNNRAHGSKRFAERRFTSRPAVKKPQNTQSLDEGFVHPRTNFTFIRLPSIITWQRNSKLCNDKASKLCTLMYKSRLREEFREKGAVRQNRSRENFKFSRRERFERFIKNLL